LRGCHLFRDGSGTSFLGPRGRFRAPGRFFLRGGIFTSECGVNPDPPLRRLRSPLPGPPDKNSDVTYKVSEGTATFTLLEKHVRDSAEVCHLICSVKSLRFLGSLLWFVLGPGGLQEAPGDRGNAHGGLSGASREPPDPLGPGSENLKVHTFCRVLLSGRVFGALDACLHFGRNRFL
jgi:hypothetical protein